MRRKRNRKLSGLFGFGFCGPVHSVKFEGEDDLQGGGGGVTPKSNVEDALAQRLQGLDRTMQMSAQQQQAMFQIMQDPMIQQVLAARQGGKKIKLVDEQEASQTTKLDEPEVPLDQMSQTQLFSYLNKSMTHSINNMLPGVIDKVLESKLGPIQQQLGGVQNFIGQSVEQKTQGKIQEAQKKYTDFMQFGPQMMELYKNAPGLEPEELYLVAKARAGSPVNPITQMESERPQNTVTRPSLASQRKAPLPGGQRGFDQLMGEALKRVDLSMFSEG